MAEINLCNSAGRDAVVKLQSLSSPLRVRWLDTDSRQVSTARMIKSSVNDDLDSLLERHGDLRTVGAAIRDGDPELNVEVAGRQLQDTSRVFVDRSRNGMLFATRTAPSASAGRTRFPMPTSVLPWRRSNGAAS
jgi:hypothetical protein